jgi:tetratricopeptide (TPR) repeat protein
MARVRGALSAGRVGDAEKICRELVRKHPREAELLYQLGVISCLQGRVSAAVPFWRRAVDAAPDEPQYKRALAHGLAEVGQLDAAVDVASSATELSPSSAEGQLQLAGLLRRAKRFDEAIARYQRVIELVPESAAAHGDLGNLLAELGRTEAAIECFAAAVKRDPDFADGWANLGATLYAADHAKEAILACYHAVVKAPKHPTAWLTLGNALAAEGRWGGAVAAYDAAVKNDPAGDSAKARYNRALADLAVGNFARGWTEYRLRHAVDPTVRSWTGLPRWGGESLDGKWLLVRREQGIGTQVMFSGYLPLAGMQAERVFVECDARLTGLLARSYPGVDFLTTECLLEQFEGGGVQARRIDQRLPDVETAIGDLPSNLLGVAPAENGPVAPRLAPDPNRIEAWRRRLAELPGGLKVGVSWRGGSTEGVRRKRSTALADWSGLLATPGASFVNLQYGAVDEELRSLPTELTLARWPHFDPTRDLDELAALAATLDLVVTVDNSTAHLAAASGATAWVLLPAAADWRWMCDASRTVWYPAARLIRQAAQATWAQTLAVVVEEVRGRATAASTIRSGANSSRTAA